LISNRNDFKCNHLLANDINSHLGGGIKSLAPITLGTAASVIFLRVRNKNFFSVRFAYQCEVLWREVLGLPAVEKTQFARRPKEQTHQDRTADGVNGRNSCEALENQSKILIDRGVFELEDAPVLLAYCNAFHLMLEAERVIAKDGMTVSSEMGGLKKHPAINVRNDSVSQLARLGSLLG
jgi:hypothetical protein